MKYGWMEWTGWMYFEYYLPTRRLHKSIGRLPQSAGYQWAAPARAFPVNGTSPARLLLELAENLWLICINDLSHSLYLPLTLSFSLCVIFSPPFSILSLSLTPLLFPLLFLRVRKVRMRKLKEVMKTSVALWTEWKHLVSFWWAQNYIILMVAFKDKRTEEKRKRFSSRIHLEQERQNGRSEMSFNILEIQKTKISNQFRPKHRMHKLTWGKNQTEN